MKYLTITFLSLMLSLSAWAQQTHNVSYSPVIPKLDGNINDDPAWSRLAWSAQPFRVYKTGKPAVVNTRFKTLYTDDALYFAFECSEPHMDKLKSEVNGDEFWNFDMIELFIFPRKDELIHLAVSSGGLTGQEIPAAVSKRTKFMTAWRAAAKRNKTSWTCEFWVPFNLVGAVPDAKAVELPFTAVRHATPSNQYSTWTVQSNLRSTDAYGRLVLQPAPKDKQAVIRRTLVTPHYLALTERWRAIRADRAWKSVLLENASLAAAIEKIYADPSNYAKNAFRLADLMEKVFQLAEKKERSEFSRMKKRFFEE